MPRGNRFCVSVRYTVYGSLMSSFVDTLELAIKKIEEYATDTELLYMVLVEESTLTVELIKGHTTEPFHSYLDVFYTGWKIGKIRK